LRGAVIEARRDIGASDRGQLQSAADRYAAFGARQGLAFLDLVIGEHLLARGSLDDAIEHLDTAIASWRSSGLRLFEPAMRALRAVAAFRRDGDRAALEAERNQILAGCQSGGAGGIRAEVERIFADAL